LISSSIKDHGKVLALLKNNPRYLETFTTYSPAPRFIEAEVGEANLSFSVQDEDGSIFAMALGDRPVILQCDRLVTSRGVDVDISLFKFRNNWDFYSIDTDEFSRGEPAVEAKNFDEIKDLLDNHAPKSSVWPGNEEVIFWGEIRREERLVATGALVKWRTGEVMFASIATHSDHRGRGVAQQLVSQMLTSANKKGISHIGLGVFAENTAAKLAYEKVGFSLVQAFSSYDRITI
jgi:ribosomal protein S18 acetylase RimI-like enzyme